MKPIIRVAKLELNLLFSSPVAWLLGVVLLIQCGMLFPDFFQTFVKALYDKGPFARHPAALTGQVFAARWPPGLFPYIQRSLYLYLPLLTMGLMSRETGSGTIKLLYSSPVKAREIIFGKFAAMMVYNLLLAGLLGIFVLFGALTIVSPDKGLMLSDLLGLYLLLCTYTAIGLFMSCLTSYQVVAALSTLVVFTVLNYIGTVWQGIDFVRDLTYFLSISGRISQIDKGLITTKDVSYFVLIVYMFLGFSVCRLLDGRESRPALFRAGRYTVIFISALLAGYATSRPRFTAYYDVTAGKINTLTVSSQRILKTLGDEPLEITSYINLLDDDFFVGARDQRNADVTRWEPYVRFKPDIRFRYVYYYDSVPNPGIYTQFHGVRGLRQIAERKARILHLDLNDFKTPAEIHQIIDLRPESNRYVMQLKYKNRSTFLRLFDDPERFPDEQETSAALERLLSVRVPKMVFVQGHLERNPYTLRDRDYAMLTGLKSYRYSMVNHGFDVDTVSSGIRDIPSDATVLVVADPRVDLDTATMGRLDRYIDGGGNLLIAGEPGKQAVLNPLLRLLGVQLRGGILVQPGDELPADVVLANLTKTAVKLSTAVKYILDNDFPISMPSAAALAYPENGPFTIRPLLLSDTSGWITDRQLVLDSGDIRYSPESGDLRGAFPTALCLTRPAGGKEQRIIVLGDADVLNNAEMNRKDVTTGNLDFGTALFGWFTYGEFPIDVSRPRSRDNSLRLTPGSMVYVNLAFRWLLPALAAAFGIVLLLKRRKK